MNTEKLLSKIAAGEALTAEEMQHILANLIDEYIEGTGDARRETRNGRAGVTFLDEMQWIPLADLGYNELLGFYQISQFPAAENKALPYGGNDQ